MKCLFFAVVSMALIAGCGKMSDPSRPQEEPASLAEARANMQELEANATLRGAYFDGDLKVDLYWGSDGAVRECRKWDLLLSRTDGQLLEYRRSLYTEASSAFTDTITQEGNNVRVSTVTFRSADGMRLKIAEGVSVNISGSMVNCDQTNGFKRISFSVTRKAGIALLNGGVRMLDKHHYIASFLQ